MLPVGTLTVAVIDDNRMVRDVLAAMLSGIDGLHGVASEAVDEAFLDAHRPGVVLLDAGLAETGSVALAAAIREWAPYTSVIAMDLIPSHEDIAEFINAGVAGFVMKDASFEELVEAVRAVSSGQKVLPQRLTTSLFSQIASENTGRIRGPVLDAVRMTRREHEVIELIGEGLSNKEIAMRLNIATHTVKSHVRNVMEKLALHTRLQIAAYSHREGQA